MSFKKSLFAIAVLLVISCGKIDNPEIIVDEGSKASLVMNDIPAEAVHTEKISFTASEAWTVSVAAGTKASGDVNWVKVSPDHGDAGTYTLTISLDANTDPEPRSATVSINCGEVSQNISVSQLGARISIFNVWKITGMTSETGATGTYEAFEKSSADGYDVAEILLSQDASGKWAAGQIRDYKMVSGDIYGGVMKYEQFNASGKDRGMTYTFSIDGNDMTLTTAGNDGSWTNTLYLTRETGPFEYSR